MIKNYLLTAWRNIRKSKGFSLINIVGLAARLSGQAAVAPKLRLQDAYRFRAIPPLHGPGFMYCPDNSQLSIYQIGPGRPSQIPALRIKER
jgi:hypothetical protein